jgi:hypothetical protein
MSISAFLDPADEAVDDDDEEIFKAVVEAYSEGDRAQEMDKEPMKVILMRQQEAMDSIQLLQRYKEQQEDGDSDILRQLA